MITLCYISLVKNIKQLKLLHDTNFNKNATNLCCSGIIFSMFFVFFIFVYVLFVLRLFRSFITSLFYTTYDKKFLKKFRHFTITPDESSWLDLIFTLFLLPPSFLQFVKVYFLSTGPANSSSENSKNQRACPQMNTNTYTFFRCQILRPCISPLHLSSHQLNEGIFFQNARQLGHFLIMPRSLLTRRTFCFILSVTSRLE